MLFHVCALQNMENDMTVSADSDNIEGGNETRRKSTIDNNMKGNHTHLYVVVGKSKTHGSGHKYMEMADNQK